VATGAVTPPPLSPKAARAALPFRPLNGAPVASLRSRNLRSSEISIKAIHQSHENRLPLPQHSSYKYTCPRSARPLAGFVLVTVGRFSTDPRGEKCELCGTISLPGNLFLSSVNEVAETEPETQRKGARRLLDQGPVGSPTAARSLFAGFAAMRSPA
jgi:hypothetical protein